MRPHVDSFYAPNAKCHPSVCGNPLCCSQRQRDFIWRYGCSLRQSFSAFPAEQTPSCQSQLSITAANHSCSAASLLDAQLWIHLGFRSRYGQRSAGNCLNDVFRLLFGVIKLLTEARLKKSHQMILRKMV